MKVGVSKNEGGIEVKTGRHLVGEAVGLVLRECIWNATAVSLVLPTFDDTGFLGSLPRRMVYPPSSMVLPWVTASRFLAAIGMLS